MNTHRRPLIVAMTVLSIGVLASLAGNVQAINLDNAHPGIGAHISAVFWPLALFGIVELLLHTPWLSNWRDRLTKGAAVLTVAGVAAWVSYWHLANVLSHYGYDVASRYAGPLAIDMAMVLATLALNRIGQARRTAANVQDKPTAAPVSSVRPAPVTSQSEDIYTSTASQDITLMGGVLRLGEVSMPMVSFDQAAADVRDALDMDGETLASEVDSYLAKMSNPLQDTTTPAVPVVSGELPTRTRAPRIDEAAALDMVRQGIQEGMTMGQIDQMVAEWFKVNPRTVRRLRGVHGLS